MLITPRTYQLSQTPSKGLTLRADTYPTFRTLRGWSIPAEEVRRAVEMLLIHQVGGVKVGEVVRYTLTYTPSADRILPPPTELYVKVKNTSALALRAAYLHGPYTVHTSCYPANFDPNRKYEQHETDGVPQFEPNLQPGTAWDAVIPVPERIRDNSAKGVAGEKSLTWVIEIASQVLFSSTATVHFEVLVGRDANSVELGAATVADLPAPGNLRDHHKRGKGQKRSTGNLEGVYSESTGLQVDDTSNLWSTPRFPSWQDEEAIRNLELSQSRKASGESERSPDELRQDGKKRKKIHFVVLTHGLHGNLGADMLYVKESIDAAAKKAGEDARKARRQKRSQDEQAQAGPSTGSPETEDEDDEDEEEVIVRGFPGNSTRTERGIQYLGKRLAKYVLLMTYPDQPYVPIRNPTFGRALTGQKTQSPTIKASHAGSTIYRREPEHKDYAYQITSISFIGHSLGGLVQTYAIAYIQKHSPEFFEHIKPINFVALASPFLGLSNENPIYIRFALDFGVVGRTGQDLGLTWSAPSKVRSGWEAMIGGLGTDTNKSQKQPDPGSKPLLRILPSGPAHQVLKRFKNRTLYSNVVNDGIVPLRTSCLLFLDWRGLERVDKARRENGLVGIMAEWSWAALTGATTNSVRPSKSPTSAPENGGAENGNSDVPQPSDSDARDQGIQTTSELPQPNQFLSQHVAAPQPSGGKAPSAPSSPLSSFFSFFRPQGRNTRDTKGTKIYKRSQTVRVNGEGEASEQTASERPSRPQLGRTRGDSLYQEGDLNTPPKTTIFESAGHVLSPPLPTTDFLLDPSSRPRTIFHDRIYHPGDIPPPPPTKPRTIFRSASYSSSSDRNPDAPGSPAERRSSSQERPGSSGMKVEEKIARAYHRDLTWRKVLVRLEPDAHNNIIVRRMFANAYGWPVVKHLVDTHFAYTERASAADEDEQIKDRAMSTNLPATETGEEVTEQTEQPKSAPKSPPISSNPNKKSLEGNTSEENDTVPEMVSPRLLASSSSRLASPNICPSPLDLEEDMSFLPHGHNAGGGQTLSRASSVSKSSVPDSARWTDRYLEDDADDDDDSADGGMGEERRFNEGHEVRAPHAAHGGGDRNEG